MPNFSTGNFKQKNKQFKGKRRANKSFKGADLKMPSSKLTKIISKKRTSGLNLETQSSGKRRRNQKIKNIRKNQQKVRLRHLRDKRRLAKVSTIGRSSSMSPSTRQAVLANLKILTPTKIVLLMDTNGQNAQALLAELVKHFGGTPGNARIDMEQEYLAQPQSSVWDYVHICGDDHKLKQFRGKSYLFVRCVADPLVFLDMCKVADVLVPVCGTTRVDFQKLNTNPKDALNAIDDWGLRAIVWLRSQGLLPVQPVVTQIQNVPSNKAKNLKFYLDRLFKEEFNTENSTMFVEKPADLTMLMLKISGVSIPDFVWRRRRGYMLTEKVSIEDNKVILQGQARGAGFSLNELVHITGLGDFAPVGLTVSIGRGHQLKRDSYRYDACDPMDVFAKDETPITETQPGQMQLGLEVEEQEDDDGLDDLMQQVQGMNVEPAGFVFEESSEDELSFDEGEFVSQKRRPKREILQLNKREQHELQFQDEVEFEAQVELRERLKDYRYLGSFNRDVWNKFDRIPDFYRRLFKFDQIERVERVVKAKHGRDLLAPDGAYVAIIFEDQSLANMLKTKVQLSRPMIVSNLFKHERKMTLSHHLVKVHNTVEPEQRVHSKTEYLVQNGFRRFRSNLTFSSIVRESPNHKLLKTVDGGSGWCLASHYAPLYFRPNNVLMFEESEKQTDMACLSGHGMKLLMLGKNFKHDLFKVILKRIILTGYPVKTKRRRAIVKYMFFDPQDIEFFKRNEIYSREGLRGKIEEAVGTHGLVKCSFNGHLSSADTVCMNLYKRVYPKFLY